MKTRERSPIGLYTIGIAALFLTGFFLLVMLGARSYRDSVAGQQKNMQTRALLSYISTCVKSNDVTGGVSVRSSDYGQVLTIADEMSGYAVRLYRYKGNLVEDFAEADTQLQPENAQVIGATESFEIEQYPGGILMVRTDAGRVLLRVRSEGGREA